MGGYQDATQNIFDNPVFFDGYKKLRKNPDNGNLLLEKPAPAVNCVVYAVVF